VNLIIIAGMPATGKSTIAKKIAGKLGLPILEKDDIKEELFDTVGYKDLAEKRMLEAIDVLAEIKESSSYSATYDAACTRAINAMEKGNSEDFGAIRAAADELEAANATLFADAVKYMRNAANSLEDYEAYKYSKEEKADVRENSKEESCCA
jgi:cytidylate kinase